MQNKFFYLVLILIMLLPIKMFSQYGKINIDKYIQDAEVFNENQLEHSPTLIPFETIQSAKENRITDSKYYQSS